MTGDRRTAWNAWVRWDRIKPDWEAGLPPRECAKRENQRLAEEPEQRRVTAQQICNHAYLHGWERAWQKSSRCG